MTAVKKAAQPKQVKAVATKAPVRKAAKAPTISAEMAKLVERRDHYFSVLRHALDSVEKAGKTAHGAAVAYVIRYGELYRDANEYASYYPVADRLKRLLRKEKRIIDLLSNGKEGWEPFSAIPTDVKLAVKNAAIRAKNEADDKKRIQARVRANAKALAEKAKSKK